MYKKLLLLVAVMVSYNATTLSGEGEAKPSFLSSAKSGFSSVLGYTTPTPFIGLVALLGKGLYDRSMDKETMLPLAQALGLLTAATTTANLALRYIAKTSFGQGISEFSSNLYEDYCPTKRTCAASLLGLAAGAVYYKRYA